VLTIKRSGPPGKPSTTTPKEQPYTLGQKDIPEADLFWPGRGDPGKAPPELVAILGDGRFRTCGPISFPAWSPDGKWLAVPAAREVYVFDGQTGAFKQRLCGHAN
jgi:hypothetical protein